MGASQGCPAPVGPGDSGGPASSARAVAPPEAERLFSLVEFDILKIDGEFIRDLPHNATNKLLVDAVVQIARGLGKRTVAEFVADAPTLAYCQSCGIDYAQGFHIAKPTLLAHPSAHKLAPNRDADAALNRRPPH